MTSFMGFQIHKGEPDLPTKLRAYKGSLLRKDADASGVRMGRNNYTDHAIAKWYGVSFRLRWFVGLWLFAETTDAHEDGPIPNKQT